MWTALRRASQYVAPAAVAVAAGSALDGAAQSAAEAPREAAPPAAAPGVSRQAPGAPQLHLVHATSVFRHGARLPVHHHHRIAKDDGFADAHDVQELAARGALPPLSLHHTATGVPLPMPVPHIDEEEGPLRFGVHGALAGTLTGRGFRQMQAVGEDLRSRYSGAGKLLPGDVRSAAPHLYLRSTHIPRTVQSLQGVLTGLFPDNYSASAGSSAESASASASASVPPLPVYSLSTRSEYLYPNARDCPAMLEVAKTGEAARSRGAPCLPHLSQRAAATDLAFRISLCCLCSILCHSPIVHRSPITHPITSSPRLSIAVCRRHCLLRSGLRRLGRRLGAPAAAPDRRPGRPAPAPAR